MTVLNTPKMPVLKLSHPLHLVPGPGVPVFADKRYNSHDKRGKLPGWITTHLKVGPARCCEPRHRHAF